MRNIDRIKSMSVDELAVFLEKQECIKCIYYHISPCDEYDCIDGIKQWLLAEVEE